MLISLHLHCHSLVRPHHLSQGHYSQNRPPSGSHSDLPKMHLLHVRVACEAPHDPALHLPLELHVQPSSNTGVIIVKLVIIELLVCARHDAASY